MVRRTRHNGSEFVASFCRLKIGVPPEVEGGRDPNGFDTGYGGGQLCCRRCQA